MRLPARAFTPRDRMAAEHTDFSTAHPIGQPWPGVLYLHAWDMLLHGFPWEAHEAWEHLWRGQAGADRSWLQGLIRLAAALVKAREQNRAGVIHHLAGAWGHWRAAGMEPLFVTLLPLLRDWLEGPVGLQAVEIWLANAASLPTGTPGPVLLPGHVAGCPETLYTSLSLLPRRIGPQQAENPVVEGTRPAGSGCFILPAHHFTPLPETTPTHGSHQKDSPPRDCQP